MNLKKRIFIGVLFFLIVSFGFCFWLFQRISNIQENKELSKSTPQYILSLFNKKSADDYPYEPQNIDWKGKYLLFESYADLSYNKKINEALGTHSYFPNGVINGLVLVKPETKILGYYKKNDDDLETTSNQAIQQCYVVSYFDLTERAVFAIDTVWGPLPKDSKRAGENQHGVLPLAGNPDESELIEMIQKRVKYNL